MLYASVRLAAHRQLKKVAGDLLKESVAEIRTRMEYCCDALFEANGIWLWVSGTTPLQCRIVCQALQFVSEFLGDRKTSLHGFAIGLIASEVGNLDQIMADSKRMLLTAPHDGAVWADANAAVLLEGACEIESVGDHRKVAQRRSRENDTEIHRDEFLVDMGVVDQIHERVYDYYSGKPGAFPLAIIGQDAISRARTIDFAVESLSAGHQKLVTRRGGMCSPPFEELISTLLQIDNLCSATKSGAIEEQAWRAVLKRVRNGRDHVGLTLDLEIALLLAFRRYERFAAEVSIVPIWTIHECRSLSDGARTVIDRVLGRPALCQMLVVIMSSSVPPSGVSAENLLTMTEMPDRPEPHLDPTVDMGGAAAAPDRITEFRIAHALRHPAGLPDSAGVVIEDRSWIRDSLRSSAVVLAALVVSDDVITLHQFTAFMKESGILDQRLRYEIEYLQTLGYLEPDGEIRISEDSLPAIKELPANKELELWRNRLLSFLLSEEKAQRLAPTIGLGRFAHRRSPRMAARAYLDVCRQLFERNELSALETLLDELSDANIPEVELVVKTFRLRLFDRSIDLPTDAASFSVANDEVRRGIEAEYCLAVSERHEEGRTLHQAIAWSKNALILSSGIDGFAEGRSNLTIGRQMLLGGRVNEARSYFEYGLEIAERDNDVYAIVNALTRSAEAEALFGNYSGSLRTLSRVMELSEGEGHPGFLEEGLILGARIYFELGRYQEAIGAAGDALSICRLYDSSGPARVAYALLLRASAYAGRFPALRSEAVSSLPERRIIEAEWLFLEGRVSEAAEELQMYEAESVEASDNGIFSVLEGRAGIRVPRRLVPALTLLLSSRMGTPEPRFSFSEMIREERLDPLDCHNGFYCYCYSEAIVANSGHDVERATALNRAVKYVLERAARIDEAKVRHEFVQGNHWNRKIMKLAKANKLA